MLKVLRRSYGSFSHDRTIKCLFEKEKIVYSIPVYFDIERRTFGYFLDIKLDITDLDRPLTFQKKFSSFGCCDQDKALEHWKSVLKIDCDDGR